VRVSALSRGRVRANHAYRSCTAESCSRIYMRKTKGTADARVSKSAFTLTASQKLPFCRRPGIRKSLGSNASCFSSLAACRVLDYGGRARIAPVECRRNEGTGLSPRPREDAALPPTVPYYPPNRSLAPSDVLPGDPPANV